MQTASGSAARKAVLGAALFAVIVALCGFTQSAVWNTSDSDLGGPDRKIRIPVTKASMPSSVQPYPRIETTLQCIRRTGVLRNKTFVVGPFADSTGKINAVAAGATGNFIPQGGSASYITDALTKAGGQVAAAGRGQTRQRRRPGGRRPGAIRTRQAAAAAGAYARQRRQHSRRGDRFRDRRCASRIDRRDCAVVRRHRHAGGAG
jgi:hypothetical protein